MEKTFIEKYTLFRADWDFFQRSLSCGSILFYENRGEEDSSSNHKTEKRQSVYRLFGSVHSLLIRYILGQIVVSLFLFGLFLLIFQIYSRFDTTFLFSGFVLLIASSYCSIDVFFVPRIETVEKLLLSLKTQHVFASLANLFFLWYIHRLTRNRHRFMLFFGGVFTLTVAIAFLNDLMLVIDGNLIKITSLYPILYYPFHFFTMLYSFLLLITYSMKSKGDERRILILQIIGFASLQAFGSIEIFGLTMESYSIELASYFPESTSLGLLILGICITLAFGKRLIQLMNERNVMQRLSMTDSLTNLSNRRAFYECLEREIVRSQRFSTQASLLLIDADNFKKLNDTYGHLAGDAILKELSNCLKQTLRATDLPARYGGEEFVVILPRTGKNGALNLAEKLRREVESLAMDWHGTRISITISIGCATYPEDAETVRELFDRSDTSLYYSKTHGKNRVSHYFLGMKEKMRK